MKSYRVTKVLEKESHINKKPQNKGREQEILPGFYDSNISTISEVENEQVRQVYGHETKTELEKLSTYNIEEATAISNTVFNEFLINISTYGFRQFKTLPVHCL